MSRKRIVLTAAVAVVALAGLAYGVASDRAPTAQPATRAALACPHAGTVTACAASHRDVREAAMPAAHDCGACRPTDAAAMGCPYADHTAGEGSCPYASGSAKGHCTRSTEPAFRRTDAAPAQAGAKVLIAAR